MTTISVTLDSSEVRRWLKRRLPQAVDRATARGLNKAIKLVRTQSIRGVAQERAIPQKQIRQQMSITSALPKPHKLRAVLRMTGRPIPLKHYGARVQGRRGRGNRKQSGPGASPVTVEIIKGRRVVVQGAFLGPNDHVYKRRGKARLPIKKLFGPSLPTAFVKPVVEQAMRHVAITRTPGLIEREMRRELRRA